MATPNLSSGPGSAPRRRRLRALSRSSRQDAQQQRARLLGAMVEIVAHGGYARTSIGELARRAGVSRGTFYELFADKEECFLSAFDEQQERLKQSSSQREQACASRSLEFFIDALVSYAAEHPRPFEFLFHEALLGGRPRESPTR